MIKVSELSKLIEGDIVLVKIDTDYFPIEVKMIVNTSLSKYIVGTNGVAYSLNELYLSENEAS